MTRYAVRSVSDADPTNQRINSHVLTPVRQKTARPQPKSVPSPDPLQSGITSTGPTPTFYLAAVGAAQHAIELDAGPWSP